MTSPSHMLFALLLGTGIAIAGTASAQLGTVGHGESEMPVVHAVAVWDPEHPRFRVYLFPYELTAEEIELCRSDDVFDISKGRLAKDPENATYHTHAAYTLNWLGPEGEGDTDKAIVRVRAQSILRRNVSSQALVMLDFPHEGVEQTLEGKLEPGAEIHLKARGEQEVTDSTVSWDLDIRVEILSSTE